MKKVILFTSLITLSSFLLSACPRNKKLLERKDSDNVHNVKSESASNVDPNVKSESASNVYPIERESENAVVMSPADWEKSIRDDIERETYRSNVLLSIVYENRHFWYKSPNDSYVVGDCALYAVVRFLHHAGKLGIVDENLWKTSNQQLRDMLADRIGPNARDNGKTSDSIREPKEWLSNLEILTLLSALDVPKKAIETTTRFDRKTV